jgi:hypothetical protein
MNLHAIVARYVGAVNPMQLVTMKVSTGFTTNSDFSRTPTYSTNTLRAQIQALQFDDIKQIEGMGIQGLRRKVYLYGNYNGLVRGLQKGGDLIVFPDISEWKIAFVFETFGQGLTGQSGWCSVCVTLQSPTSEG